MSEFAHSCYAGEREAVEAPVAWRGAVYSQLPDKAATE